MKKLRMTLATSMLLFLTAIVLQSCLDDWDDKYDTLFAVGTVKVIEGKDYYFSLDEGSKLYPSDTTYVHDYAVIDGQRAVLSALHRSYVPSHAAAPGSQASGTAAAGCH